MGCALLLTLALAASPGGVEELQVHCASSLRAACEALGKRLEAVDPGVRVRVSSAGSQQLRVQLEHGAPADVVATADRETMAALESAGQVEAPRPLASNRLVIALAPGVRLERLSDLPRLGRIALAAAEVPLGAYSEAALARAGLLERVLPKVVTRELSAGQVLGRVLLGEVDAAIVYASELAALQARGLGKLELPAGLAPAAEYPIAVAKRARATAAAERFVALATSREGAQVLRSLGFVVDVSPGSP